MVVVSSLCVCAENNQQEIAEKRVRRVYVDMVADMFHPGHVAFFKKAREFGDYLIVGLLSDEVCADYKRVPIMTLEERVAAVSACKYVDEVIAGAPLCVTDELLDQNEIDVVIHGDDYTAEQVEKYYGAAVLRGIYRTVPYTHGISTSDLIRRIRSRSWE